MALYAGTDSLHKQPHRLAVNVCETFYPQHVRQLTGSRHAGDKTVGISCCRQLNNETVEVIMFVIKVVIMMGAAIIDVGLGGGPEAKQDLRINAAGGGWHNFDGAGQMRAEMA
jgi:hypothetical protein